MTTDTPTRYLEWPTSQLKALLVRNPSMAAALQTVFNHDLIRKIRAQDEIKAKRL